MRRVPIIAVVGASVADASLANTAEKLGAAIAKKGWTLICGGGGGVMEAVSKGFLEGREKSGAKGVSIGILPGEDPGWANDYVDIVLPTGIGWARNAIIARSATAIIAVGGCSGTLTEIAYAWQMGKPVVALADSGGWSGKLAGNSVDDRRKDVIVAATSPVHAVDLTAALIGEMDESPR